MGDLAEEIYDRVLEEQEEWESLLMYFNSLSNEELVNDTATARLPIVVGIRRYWKRYKKLSKKQRKCLVFWLAKKDWDEEYSDLDRCWEVRKD